MLSGGIAFYFAPKIDDVTAHVFYPSLKVKRNAEITIRNNCYNFVIK